MGEEKNGTSPAVDQSKLQDMIAETDTGARSPTGIPAKVLWFVPLGVGRCSSSGLLRQCPTSSG